MGTAEAIEEGYPRVTIALIVINVVVYMVASFRNFFMSVGDYWVETGSYVPLLLLEDPVNAYRMLTAMFLHGDILHIFFNMYFLYVFGKSVENALGSMRFAILYFMSGLLASIFHTAFSYIQGPSALMIPAIGASGAISGVLGAYLLLYPGTSLSACWFFFIFPVCFTIRAAYWLIFWFATQVIYGYARLGTAIAFFAHAGGYVTGIALLPLVVNRERLDMLRLWSRFRPLFNVIFSGLRDHEGLGKYAKALMAALITSLIAGSMVVAVVVGQLSIFIAGVEGRVSNVGTISDVVVFSLSNGDLDTQSITNTYLRILINRLAGLDILMNTSASNKVIYLSNVELQSRLKVVGKLIDVPTYIYNMKLTYGLDGILTSAEGRFKTFIVRISDTSYSLSDEVTYEFNMTVLGHYDASRMITSASMASLTTSLIALAVVLFKDKDLAIIS